MRSESYSLSLVVIGHPKPPKRSSNDKNKSIPLFPTLRVNAKETVNLLPRKTHFRKTVLKHEEIVKILPKHVDRTSFYLACPSSLPENIFFGNGPSGHGTLSPLRVSYFIL